MPTSPPSPTPLSPIELNGQAFLRKDEAVDLFMAQGLDYKAASYALYRAVLSQRIETVPVHKRLRLYRATDVEAELARRKAGLA